MSKAKLKVEVKTGSQGEKVAELKPNVAITQASGQPKGKPVYRPKAKLTAHITINGRKRK